MRMMMLAAAAALALTGTAYAAAGSSGTGAAPAGTYSLNAAGKCVGPAPKTTFAKQSLCAKPAAAASNHCKDPKTKKFVKCGTPGAVPA
jgi:hypothetical protein